MGKSNAIPKVADNPGIAPNIIPNVTTPKISNKLIG